MKKLARWILPTVVFIIIGLFLLDGMTELLRRKAGQQADMIHCLYEQSGGNGTADVLCIGTSHGYRSFLTNYLWKQYGITSLAMCSPGQTIACSYYVLKEALRYEKPKVVLLESYYFYYGQKLVDQKPRVQFRKVIDGLRNLDIKHEMITDMLAMDSRKEKLTYYLPFLQYHSRWNDLRNYDFHPYYYLRGSLPSFTTYPMEKPPRLETPTKIAAVNIEYFEKIMMLCNEYDIPLVVYAAPYGDDNYGKKYMKKQGCNVALEAYLAEKDIPFLFYQKMEEINFDYSADFMNSTHLNKAGAEKLCQHLGAWLQENYGIEDHRGDANYRFYEDDYKQYEKMLLEAPIEDLDE